MIYLIKVPEEFQFDPVSKSFGDPTRRPEVKTSTIEFIAPSEYMVIFIYQLYKIMIIDFLLYFIYLIKHKELIYFNL